MSKLEPKNRKRLTAALMIVLVWLSFSLASTPSWDGHTLNLEGPPLAEAAYGNRKRTDSWGDAIQITANYNIGGGHIDFKAVSGKNGVKISSYGIGYTLGVPITRIKRAYVYVKCYNAAGTVIKRYSRSYSLSRSSWRKTVSVPAGTTRIYAKMSVKFLLLISPFPTRTLSTSLYA